MGEGNGVGFSVDSLVCNYVEFCVIILGTVCLLCANGKRIKRLTISTQCSQLYLDTLCKL